MTFKQFAKAIAKQIETLKQGQLFEVDLPKDDLWALYLASFPEGSNPIYKTNTEHDCNNCKHFIHDIGRVISLKNGEVMTAWDVEVGGAYQVVVDALAKRVRQAKILNVYSHWSETVGVEFNQQLLASGAIKTWNHFHGTVDRQYVNISETKLSEIASTVAVFRRGLLEIKPDVVETVLELIDQNSIYRGAEFKPALLSFRDLQQKFAGLDDLAADRFVWSTYKEHGARIRNTAIGTLLQDLSADDDLDKAVRAFEAKVAPQNYKRPTALITKAMVEEALAQVRADDIEDSLYRRFAVLEDLSVNDILFADRSVRPAMRDSLSDALMNEVKEKPRDFSGTKEIHIDEFLANVLPHISSMDVCFEAKHEPNLVSLIGPLRANSANLFKWGNPFSWSYNGNVTDSLKERVKAAGGKVDGYLRVSLSWFNFDDLDLHVREPDGTHIYFRNKLNHWTGGHLDVDMNAGGGTTRQAVENVTWPESRKMQKGIYTVVIHNFSKRESIDVGFDAEIECAGEVWKFNYQKAVANSAHINLATFMFDGVRVREIQRGDPDVLLGSASKTVWGIDTNKFHKVSLLTLSPNHWQGERIGNKHFIFVLDQCKTPDRARGFYNEFLPSKYDKYRKVFEILGDKTKCEPADKQLSGLGFSSTKEASIVCKVSGNINRTIKLIF